MSREDSLCFYLDGDNANILNYKTNEYALLYEHKEAPDFNFQDISENGKLIGFSTDINGDYVITLLDLVNR